MINNVVLTGRLTKDPELRKTQSGTSVMSFTVAVNRKFKKDGEETADFVNCVAWNQTADYLANYHSKGSLIGVEGRIQTRNYEDKTGNRVFVTEVVADSVTGLSYGNDNGNDNNGYHEDETVDIEEEFGSPTLDISSDDLPF